MSKFVSLYTKPDCVQCDAVKRWVNDRHIDLTWCDLSENPEALEKVQSLGYKQAPVVEIFSDGVVVDTFAGFQVSKLNKHFPSTEYPKKEG